MKTFAVVPTYKAGSTLEELVRRTLSVVDVVVVVDDNCPQKSGDLVKGWDRVEVISRTINGGVGAATKDGIEKSLELGADIILKIDSDLQMLPESIPDLVAPIQELNADFVKGTRFDSPEDLEQMPKIRMIGNAGLSLISKFSTGYWSLNDPTNGFIAMPRKTAQRMPWAKVADDFFFESDLLFRLRLIQAKVAQVQMRSIYAGEQSSLRPAKVLFPFLRNHFRNHLKRVAYMYLFREWNLGTLYLPASTLGFAVGITAAVVSTVQASSTGTGVGTVVLASLSLILATQFLLQFLIVDMQSEPR